MSFNPQKTPAVRKQVDAVQFCFYTDQEVRDRSVVEITAPVSFDPTGTALPGGLYDPRLGPIKAFDPPCPTCALKCQDCPGHYGHIELIVPLYHPLLFPELVTLLRCKCWSCHALKAPVRPMKILKAKWNLWAQGRYNELADLDNQLAAVMKEGRGNAEKQGDQNRMAALALDDHLKFLLDTPTQTQSAEEISSSSRDGTAWRKILLKETLSLCKSSNKCHSCGAFSPKIRQDSHNKIFQSALSANQKRLNAAEGVKLTSALGEEEEEEQQNEDNNGYDSEDSHRPRDAMELDDASEDAEDSEEEEQKKGTEKSRDIFIHSREVQAQVQKTWKLQPLLCQYLFGDSPDIFFVQVIPVPPNRFRPPMALSGGTMQVEHVQTAQLSELLTHHERLRNQLASGKEEAAFSTWIDLQTTYNIFIDAAKDPRAGANQQAVGIKQILERKEGLFRKNMMGKRVNYACRSVISPDPYIGTNEIGLPHYFASVLTYPVPVTDWNVRQVRQWVEQGPEEYPAARWVEMNGKRMDLSKMNQNQRRAIAAQLLTRHDKSPTIVGRQLRDGDYVLMNRQPTLHKPGIMAHRVRVLYNRNQRTIRMHYANCNTYNADFDGDEMNCHYPQSDLARAEAQYIASTDLQYIVPTDGSPLRGLIQDHVVGGVMLTKKDTFLEKWEFHQLLFASLTSLGGLEVIRSDEDIKFPPPTIRKPRELWTGKQVITALLLNLSRGHDRDTEKTRNLPGLSTERKAKTPESAFGTQQEEHLVLIRDGELLRGILDKSAFGATDFSLVHAVQEAYGGEKAGLLLNALGRLFTAYIQYFAGHSCRVEDLILTEKADSKRRKLVQRAYNLGSRAAKAWADSDGGKVTIDEISEKEYGDIPLKPVEAAATAAKIGELLSGNEGKENFAALDGYMQSKLNPLSSGIVKESLPSGLAVPFPYNTFSVMTTTGAKGSIVNQSQVTCALGQQALEGRRVPRMSSGRTLPSFMPYDPHPRADGFVMDRFLTGVRPQEYYFHTMSGRIGLVDTAVKTSRSGYLQRCLVKHLEELKVCYDYTVRDAEGSVIQFLYGEDGLDPTKACYLDCSNKSFDFMARNHKAMNRNYRALHDSTVDVAAEAALSVEASKEGDEKPLEKGDLVTARRLRHGHEWTRGAMLKGWSTAIITKVHKKGSVVDLKYLSDNVSVQRVPVEVDLGDCGSKQQRAASSIATIVKRAPPDPVLGAGNRSQRLGSSGACVSERVASAAYKAMEKTAMKQIMSSSGLSRNEFSSLVGAKYSNSLCYPGEAVGCIAAQSIGEPSTQMTLNTFHLAGAGANVTLGIPRVREIIMTASRELKTPTMSVPLQPFVTDKQAVRLSRDFTRLTLLELLAGDRGVSVTERLEKVEGTWERTYYVVLKFYAAERIKEAFGLRLKDIAKIVAATYVPLLSRNMKKELRRGAIDGDEGVVEVSAGGQSNFSKKKGDSDETGENDVDVIEDMQEKSERNDVLDDDDDEDDDEDDDVPADEDGMDADRHRRRKQSVSYEDDEDPENGDAQDDGSIEEADEIPQTTFDTSILNTFTEKTSPTIQEKTNSIILQPLRVDPAARPLLMVGLAEQAAAATMVLSKKKIDQAFINEEQGRGRCLQTAGVNFEEIWQLDSVDHNRLLSNDTWAVRQAYGVEAARNNIVDQIRGVFGAYGIDVNPRHLYLIADYMTFDGGYKPMNRNGMESSSSAFLQMSFETTVQFLKTAALSQKIEEIKSPSANIVVGRPVQHGTGSFSLLCK